MKKVSLITLMAFFIAVSMFGQKLWENPKYGPDSASRMECGKNLSIMSQFAKLKMYDQAYDGWKFAYENCPKASKNIYIYGSKILKAKINTASDEEKTKYTDKLVELYNKRIEYFNQESFVRGIQGLDLLKYDASRAEEANNYLRKAIELSKHRAHESVFLGYLQSSYFLYKNDKIEPSTFVNDYFFAMEHAEVAIQKKPSDQKMASTIEKMENIFLESKAGDCETIIGFMQPKFAENPEDIDLLKKITANLKELDCQESDLFVNASENLYKIEPSAQAAANLATIFYSRSQYEKAMEYYQQAVEKETDNNKKADYFYNMGSIALSQMSNPQKARTYARKAIENRSGWGKPHILIGNAYISSTGQCGENDFEKAAVYWVAVDEFQKAKNVDESISNQANDLINRYSQYFPNNEDAFFYGYTNGDSYKVGCWINVSTTVRTRKN